MKRGLPSRKAPTASLYSGCLEKKTTSCALGWILQSLAFEYGNILHNLYNYLKACITKQALLKMFSYKRKVGKVVDLYLEIRGLLLLFLFRTNLKLIDLLFCVEL